jgi:hypothetical protein
MMLILTCCTGRMGMGRYIASLWGVLHHLEHVQPPARVRAQRALLLQVCHGSSV